MCSPVGIHAVVRENCRVRTFGAGLSECALQEPILGGSRELQDEDLDAVIALGARREGCSGSDGALGPVYPALRATALPSGLPVFE